MINLSREILRENLEDFEYLGERIPEYMYEGILNYVCDGIKPGDFLTAVLTNDLKVACAHADDTNIRILFVYVAFFYNHIPAPIWSSAHNVWEHIKRMSDERQTNRNLSQELP
jgi:hypothetical protein